MNYDIKLTMLLIFGMYLQIKYLEMPNWIKFLLGVFISIYAIWKGW